MDVDRVKVWASTDPGPAEWAPAACTLPTAAQPLRLAEFDALFASALHQVHRPTPTHLILALTGAPGRVDQVRELTQRESTCCSFFTFEVHETRSEQAEGSTAHMDAAHSGALLLHVGVPPVHVAVLDALQQRAGRVASLTTKVAEVIR